MIVQLLNDRIDKYIDENEFKIKNTSTHFEYFVANVLLKNYDYTFNDLILGQVDGGGDEGIDSIYVIIDNKIFSQCDIEYEEILKYVNKSSEIRIIIVQSKTSNGFGEKPITGMQRGLTCILTDDIELSNSKFRSQAILIQNIWRAHNFVGCKTKIKFELFYASKSRNKNIATDNLRVMKEEKKIKNFIEGFGFNCEYQFLGCNELISLDKQPIEYRKSLKFIKHFAYPIKESSVVDGYMCLVNIKDYMDFITDDNEKIEDQYFEENIRDFQGSSETVNSNIIETIKGSYSDKFWCFNNGITIIAYNISSPIDNEITMSNFQIINGCQTSYSVYEAFSSIENIESINFEIVIKVINIKEDVEENWNEDLVLKIIESTNAQTKIDSFAFESHKPIHKRIEEFFLLKESPLYYERKPKYYERRGKAKVRILNPQELFKVCYSILYKRPSQTRNNPAELFKKDSEKIFSLNNNLEWFWITYNLYNKINIELIELLQKKEYTDDNIIEFIFKNGSLHLARVVFSLINKLELNITYLSSNNISDVLKNDVYNNYLLEKYDITGNLDIAIHIIKNSILELKNENNISLERLFKLVKLDEIITKNINKYLTSNPKQSNIDSFVDKKTLINNLEKTINYYSEIFDKISKNGDFRYNFLERLNDSIFLIENLNNTINLNLLDLLDTLNKIYNNNMNYSSREERRDSAKEVYRTLNTMKKRIK